MRAWRVVEHAQGPERQSVSGPQHGSGVEAQIRLTRDQGIGAEAEIEGGVRDHEQPTMLDGLDADAHVERRLAHAQADLRLEPLPLLSHEADQRNRGRTDLGCDPGQVIKGGLGWAVEDVVAVEGCEAFRFRPDGPSRRTHKAQRRLALSHAGLVFLPADARGSPRVVNGRYEIYRHAETSSSPVCSR